ncbi:Vacuolar protein sorting-associated protein 53 [Chytriomyces hyalinus]|nr:Vacuolar protein sorting-associated protein 53 [Chytriomyces hyalinus]
MNRGNSQKVKGMSTRPRSRPASAGRDRVRAAVTASGIVSALSDRDRTLDESTAEDEAEPDALNSATFDPVHYLAMIFPTKAARADKALVRVKERLVQMDSDIDSLVRSQAGLHSKGSDFDECNESMMQLFDKIRRIREKAAASEQLVQDITREITTLDQAKKNLMVSIATIKKLQMLASSLDYMKVLMAKKEYLDAAQLFEVIIKLSDYFDGFRNVAQIAVLLERVVQLRIDFKRQIFSDFDAGFVGGILRSVTRQLGDACFAVQALGPEVQFELVNWYCDTQLKDYKAIFRQNPDIASLDAVGRRYAWLKRLLKTHDEEHAAVFPEHWAVAEYLCERFCADTKKDISDVLIQTESSIDVKVMLGAIQQTIEFEGKVAGRFAPKAYDNDDDDSYDNPPPMPSKFKAIISCCFEPYLRLYIESEDRNLATMIESYKTSSEAEEEEAILVSSTDLFLFYRQTLVQCSKLSTNKPFLDLCRLFAKWLKAYAEVIAAKLPKDDKKSYTEDEMKMACLIINTADYCSQTAAQLEEKLIEKIDERYKSSVSFTNEIDAFVNVTGLAIKSLSVIVEMSADPALTVMMKRPWGTMDSVGDQSEYVTLIANAINHSVALIKRYVTTQKYLRTFFDKFSEAFLTRFYACMYRCRPISEVGAEQLLLDTHALKTVLIQMTQIASSSAAGTHDLSPTLMMATSATESKTPPPAAFLKILGRGVLKIEQVLKVVLRAHEPPAGIVETFVLLFPEGDVNAFQKILELKGLKRAEQLPVIEAYQQRIGTATAEPAKESIGTKFKLGKYMTTKWS